MKHLVRVTVAKPATADQTIDMQALLTAIYDFISALLGLKPVD
jgi:hypothetical protein